MHFDIFSKLQNHFIHTHTHSEISFYILLAIAFGSRFANHREKSASDSFRLLLNLKSISNHNGDTNDAY